MSPKAPGALDRYVGNRVRLRRLQVGMSQEKLGEALGITFQQVQKYEKGTNRVSVSRLHQIAAALGVPLTFFYEGGPAPIATSGAPAASAPAGQDVSRFVADFLELPEASRVVRGFIKIQNGAARRQVAELVEKLAREADKKPTLRARARTRETAKAR